MGYYSGQIYIKGYTRHLRKSFIKKKKKIDRIFSETIASMVVVVLDIELRILNFVY